MATKWPQGEITATQPATVLGGNNISGVYTLDQLNRLNADFGPQMQRSLRFRSSASAYLSRTPASAGNRTTWTWSGWVKRGVLGGSDQYFFGQGANSGNTFTAIRFNGSDNTLVIWSYNSATDFQLITTQVFRDPSAWYHIVLAVDTTQATSSNRVKLYVNGNQVTSFSTSTYPSQNYNTYVNSTIAAGVGYLPTFGGYFDGYMAEINFIDGQALDPSYFGKYNGTTGVWQPNIYTGTYGTNGFHLTFANNTSTTTLGYDSSPNGNNWTTNNISLTSGSTYDSMLDVPTNWTSGDPIQARGNYAVGNPLLGNGSTFADGNLAWTANTSSGPAIGTIQLPTTGKWYWEITPTNVNDMMVGIQSSSNFAYAGPKTAYYRQGGASNSIYIEGSVQSYNAASYTNGDVIAVAYNADSSQITWYKNNTQQGGPFTLTSLTNLFAIVIQASGGGSCTAAANFGQRPFSYTPPTGFISLCTQNLSQPTVFNGAGYMAATLYTGNGSTQSITNANNGVSFQPDFVWAKIRNTAGSHNLVDSVRGNTKYLYSDRTDAEGTYSDKLTSFNTNGFSLGSDSTGVGQINTNGNTFVAWQWKAGGTAVSNTAGSISSQVSANTTAGFAVVTYTGNGSAGATVGHGLGVAPAFIIIKDRTAARTGDQWPTYHVSIGASGGLVYLNSTSAGIAASTVWNNTNPTSSVFTLGNWGGINYSGDAFVAYCFAAIAGYSAFGSYTGNGSSDGPFVFLGFRPRYVLVKRTDTSENWYCEDSSRGSYNANTYDLFPNLSNAEQNSSAYSVDFLSNGFKIRTSDAAWNQSSGTYIFAAFAENPFKYSLAR